MLLLLARSTDDVDDDDTFVVCDILLNNDDLLGAIIVFELIDIPFVVGLSDVEWLNVMWREEEEFKKF